MLAAIPFDTLAFIALILIASFFRLISKEAEKTKRKSGPSTPQAPKPARIPQSEETDEERVRRFLEALGQPTSSKPPAPIDRRPRTLSQKPADTPRVRKILSPLPPLTTAPPPLPAEAEVQESIPLPVNAPIVSRVGVAMEIPARTEPLRPTVFPETSRRVTSLPNVTALLSSEHGLRDAIILREIFGPPRSLQTLEF